jgi:hypothetical protein
VLAQTLDGDDVVHRHHHPLCRPGSFFIWDCLSVIWLLLHRQKRVSGRESVSIPVLAQTLDGDEAVHHHRLPL